MSVGKVTVKNDQVLKILNNIKFFTKKTALVGVPETQNARTDIADFNKKVEASNEKIRVENKIKSQKALKNYLQRGHAIARLSANNYLTQQLLRKSKSIYRQERKGAKLGKKTIGNAELAFMFENGTSRMQARSHFEPGIQKAQPKILAALQEGASKGLLNKSALEKGLVKAALIGMESVKMAIRSVAPLKASTIAARKREGFRGTKPLRRTGAYINSIKGLVRDR